MKNNEVCFFLENFFDISFTAQIKRLFAEYVQTRTFTAGTIVLPEGEKSDNVYLIVTGLVRGYYLDLDGKEITKCFAAENEFFCTEIFRTGAPATFSIECLEDCECIELPNKLIRSVMQEDQQISYLIGRMFEAEISRLEQRNKNVLMFDAEERYTRFCKMYPRLHSRLPLKYISSFIAVRPETLSRIRKKYRTVK